MDFYICTVLLEKICGEFSNHRNCSILTKKAWAIAHCFEQGRFWKVLELTPNSLKNLALMLENGFLTAYGIGSEDLGRIFNEPKLTDFDQKAWAIAHGFEQGRFCQILELTPNSLKTSPTSLKQDS